MGYLRPQEVTTNPGVDAILRCRRRNARRRCPSPDRGRPHDRRRFSLAHGSPEVWDWWQGTAMDRLNPGGNAAVIVMAQRLNTDDLIGRLRENVPGVWKNARLRRSGGRRHSRSSARFMALALGIHAGRISGQQAGQSLLVGFQVSATPGAARWRHVPDGMDRGQRGPLLSGG